MTGEQITTVEGLVEALRALPVERYITFDGIKDSDHDDAIRARRLFDVLDRFRPVRRANQCVVTVEALEDLISANCPNALITDAEGRTWWLWWCRDEYDEYPRASSPAFQTGEEREYDIVRPSVDGALIGRINPDAIPLPANVLYRPDRPVVPVEHGPYLTWSNDGGPEHESNKCKCGARWPHPVETATADRPVGLEFPTPHDDTDPRLRADLRLRERDLGVWGGTVAPVGPDVERVVQRVKEVLQAHDHRYSIEGDRCNVCGAEVVDEGVETIYLHVARAVIREFVPARPIGVSVEQVERPTVVCLCGSTRFMSWFHSVGWERTMAGEIVLSVGVAKHVQTPDGGHVAEALGPGVAEALDGLHLQKINLADYILVLNVRGYIGESTLREIRYAWNTNKRIEYLEPLGPCNCDDEARHPMELPCGTSAALGLTVEGSK